VGKSKEMTKMIDRTQKGGKVPSPAPPSPEQAQTPDPGTPTPPEASGMMIPSHIVEKAFALAESIINRPPAAKPPAPKAKIAASRLSAIRQAKALALYQLMIDKRGGAYLEDLYFVYKLNERGLSRADVDHAVDLLADMQYLVVETKGGDPFVRFSDAHWDDLRIICQS
jgi:hypothetical protein